MREWLGEKRRECGYTAKEMSEKLNISESYYSYIENGERQKRMDITLVSKLAVIFGTPIEEIIAAEAK